jgi:endonuclease-8
MPEGDTIRKLAGFLAPALIGRIVIGVRLRGSARRDLGDRRVQGVSSKGKHLYVELEGALLA